MTDWSKDDINTYQLNRTRAANFLNSEKHSYSFPGSVAVVFVKSPNFVISFT